MIDLAPGETVLDLGSGGGLDVILSAKPLAPDGTAYGVDELDDMIAVAQVHAAEAGVTNATVLKGQIENVPLPDASVDVVISNCVICLAPDKSPVFAEIARAPPRRSNSRDRHRRQRRLHPTTRRRDLGRVRDRALQHSQLLTLLASAGLVDASIEYTHATGPGLHGATIRARRP